MSVGNRDFYGQRHPHRKHGRRGVVAMESSTAKEFGYVRISTSHQKTDRQMACLMEYGINERDIIIDKESGKNFERGGYQTLKENILRSGDTLVIKELDRLGRNKAAVKEELEWFRKNGIRVKILDIPTTLIDCKGQDWVMEMVGNILIEVMASVAEEERAKNHQRQKEGIEAAKEKGVCFGRPGLVKPEGFDEVMRQVEEGTMKAVTAMEVMGLKRTSYYKLKKMYGY